MTDQLLLGLDLGASRVKAGLFTLVGQPVALATVVLRPRQEGGIVAGEQDPEAWWQAVKHAIEQCVGRGSGRRAAALCVGGQGPSLVAIDAGGRAVRPALMFGDRSAQRQAEDATTRLGRSVSVRSAYLPRAMWIRDSEPHLYAIARWFLQAWDYIVFRLSGVAAATAPAIDEYVPWRADDLETVGLDGARFPPLTPTGRLVAVVSKGAAREIGLPAGIPIIAGGNDFLLGTVGVAGARKGIAQSQGGTTGAFTLCWDRPLAGDMIAWSIPSPVRADLVNVGGPLTTAGAALDWFLRNVIGDEGNDRALAGAAHVPAGADGLLFLPYLAGEPLLFGGGLRGGFARLALRHRVPHLSRAVLEGVALAARCILESLVAAGGEVSEVVSYGGQARSVLWNQIKADIWQRPVAIPDVAHAGCLGAAAIAAAGIGQYDSLATASQHMARVGRRFAPDMRHAAAYDAAYESFVAFLRALSSEAGPTVDADHA